MKIILLNDDLTGYQLTRMVLNVIKIRTALRYGQESVIGLAPAGETWAIN